MSLKREAYLKRLVDDKISKYLKSFGAVSIEGAKWCGIFIILITSLRA